MSGDIVERLGEIADGSTGASWIQDACREAADLITTLTAERDAALGGEGASDEYIVLPRDALSSALLQVEAMTRALEWSMDEIDVLSNKLCLFAYPQGMAFVRRDDQQEAYEAAVNARRNALAAIRSLSKEGETNG